MAHAAIQLNFVESEEGITFCAADTEDKRRECDPWNTLRTKKYKEVVASARTTFQWQSSKKGAWAPPRRRLQRVAVFKASGTETNLLGNQQ